MLDALEGAASPFSGKEPSQLSPMSERKKNRRKKSMNQKGDAAAGQAEGKWTHMLPIQFVKELLFSMTDSDKNIGAPQLNNK